MYFKQTILRRVTPPYDFEIGFDSGIFGEPFFRKSYENIDDKYLQKQNKKVYLYILLPKLTG
jgi:hypothetical protein